MKPLQETYPAYFEPYVSLVKGDDLSKAFSNSIGEADTLIKSIPEEKGDFAYAEGKWNIKEVIQHIIDAERVFAYRALAISRMDQANLPGFDEDSYAKNTDANSRTISDLMQEWKAVRTSIEYLFRSFSEKQLLQLGTANGKKISVLALGFVIIGHGNHHLRILKEKYLQ